MILHKIEIICRLPFLLLWSLNIYQFINTILSFPNPFFNVFLEKSIDFVYYYLKNQGFL